MDALERLERKARNEGISLFYDVLLSSDPFDGLYLSWREQNIHVILVNAHRPASVRLAALAEELGHHMRSHGNIVAQATVAQRRSEGLGRQWAYDCLLPADTLAVAFKQGVCSLWELAEHFSLPETFVSEVLTYHARKQDISGLNAIACHWCAAY